MIRSLSLLTFSAVLLAGSPAVHAVAGGTWTGGGPGTQQSHTVPASQMPAPLQRVGYDQRLGNQVPLGLAFHDQTGKPVHLSDFFGRRPVLLVLAYYHCPMLCDMVLSGVGGNLRTLTLKPGEQFDVVVASIDPKETTEQARAAERRTLDHYGKDTSGTGWHFLTGPQESIDALTESVGFRYVHDAERNQYAHAAGIVFLTPEGRVSRYLYGIEFSPRDVRLALIESADHKIGSLADQVLLYCFHYDPKVGRYGAAVLNIVRGGAILTVCGIVLMILLLRRRETHEPGPLGAA
ncbi:MAG TPA: SCO family protein [Thermoanaerobaculia bacterium]|nr:SCO family protein [Thermoanaerobaculia bacterium]